MQELTSLNWLAVMVSFFISFMLGWLWYSPKLFGKPWAQGVGVELADGSEMPLLAMVSQALGTLGLACFFGWSVVLQLPMAANILVLVTFMLLIVSNGKYVQKSNTAVAIEAAYILTMGAIMLICQQVL